MLREEVAAGLDAAFFATTAGSASAHAGLLYNVTATAAFTSGFQEDLTVLAPITRREPPWVLDLILNSMEDKAAIGAILAEVYKAIANGQRRLAAMGIRAALEQVMIATVGDLRTFDDKLDAFQTAGYISLLQRDAMRATLDVGDATMHRGHLPSDNDLNLALDIVEGVFAPIFAHKEPAQKLGDAVPPRGRRK